MGAVDPASFHRKDDGLKLPGLFALEDDLAVDPLIGPLLLLYRTSSNQAICPSLKLEWIGFSKYLRVWN